MVEAVLSLTFFYHQVREANAAEWKFDRDATFRYIICFLVPLSSDRWWQRLKKNKLLLQREASFFEKLRFLHRAAFLKLDSSRKVSVNLKELKKTKLV